MVNDALIGRFGPDYQMPLERGKVREFASATYAPWPVYRDDPHAVMPTTFLTTAGVMWGYTLERPRGTLFEEINHDLSVPLHAQESYIFHGPPPRVGGQLTARSSLESVVRKAGRRGGGLTFLTMLTEFRGDHDTLVAEARSVTVTTDTPGGVADTAPDYHPVYENDDAPDPFAGIEPADHATLAVGDSPGRIDAGVLQLREVVGYAAAGGETNPLHYDLAHAHAAGFPGLFGIGMHQAGGLASYAVRWLGAEAVRRCDLKFASMFFVGDPLTYEGRVTEIMTQDDGTRVTELALECRRPSDDALIVGATMQFALNA